MSDQRTPPKIDRSRFVRQSDDLAARLKTVAARSARTPTEEIGRAHV